MSLTLHVNNQSWTNSLTNVLNSFENCIVPVIKGNGYGIGKANLAKKSLELGIKEIAIGTIFEAKEVIDKDFLQIVVMDPIKDLDKSSFDELKKLNDKRIVLTLSDINDASNMKETPVIVEVLTSMKRFGLTANDLKTLANYQILGLSLHLPIENCLTGKINEVKNWIKIYNEILPQAKKIIYLSHLTKEEFIKIKNEFPNYLFKLRLGTKFWLNDLSNFQIKSSVLAVHDIKEEQIG
ncbi:MAG: alanine racemase, partial [Candidatus Nanopelagicales bacterium]